MKRNWGKRTQYMRLAIAEIPFFSRNAMDNASKNASDMIGSLQMKYNRGR